MPTTDCATQTALPDLQAPVSQVDLAEDDFFVRPARLRSGRPSKALKVMLIGFAVSVGAGLALASWYLGIRIVAADRVLPPVRVVPQPPLPAAPPVWQTVLSPEFYLQVAGFGSQQDADFAKSLQAKGFRAQVQMREDATRILIGPFKSQAEMIQGQKMLQSSGVMAVETVN